MLYPKPNLCRKGNGGEGHVVDAPLGLSPYQTAGATPTLCNSGRTRMRTEILSYDIRVSSRESPGHGNVTPSSPQLRESRRRDGRGCRPWLLSILADSGRHRSNSVKTRGKVTVCRDGARPPTLDNGLPFLSSRNSMAPCLLFSSSRFVATATSATFLCLGSG